MSGRNSHSTEDIEWRFGIAIDGSRTVIRSGITRLKQHLAHKTGDVVPCPDVSAEVKRDMMKLLTEYKEKKRQKTRIARDLEDEITRSFNRDDYEDAQLAHARYESLEQHRFEHEQRVYRACRGAHFDEGGSSRPPSVPQMRRSATIRESSSRASRDMVYEQMSTLAARLRAVEVELEKDRTRTKQSKVNTSWVKAAKNKMIKAFGSWVIDTNVPFTVVDSIYTNPLLETIREVGPDIRAPSSYELSDVFLPEGYFFNPQYMFRQSQDWEDREVRTGVQNVIMRLEPDVDKQIKAMRQVFLYKDRMDTFGTSIAQRAIASLMAVIVEVEIEEMEEMEVRMKWVLPIPLDDQLITLVIVIVIVVVVSLLKMTEEVNVPRMSSQVNRPKLIVASESEKVRNLPNHMVIQLTPCMAMQVSKKRRQVLQGPPGLFASSGGHDTYGGFSNNYKYNTNCPPLPYPSNEPQFVGSDSSRRHSDNPPIINQGTINYGDHYYYQPTFYSSNSNSSEQSWMNSTASSHYHQQQESYGVDQNNNDTYQDPPRHSF
ncbi:hypothetical protein Cgig2_027773 [Carnegiea gigantea]|uniref:Uncharacterized protein n=1 Tax=Carnegiea gigantea TaxID=171969 RepID=A0A9Q1GTB2_9CARY|nr:hypothetical protein Cgig2_027773 [Carnegiea gigantea]